jgi:hypothetical protein
MLMARGINPEGMSRGQAGAVLGRVRGRPTNKQLEVLGDCGEDVGPAMTADRAAAVLDILKARGWRPRTALLLKKDWRILPTADGYRPVYYDVDVGRVVLTRLFPTVDAARLFISRVVEDPVEG